MGKRLARQAKHEVQVEFVLQFYPALLTMLDEWSEIELTKVNRDADVQVLRERTRGQVLEAGIVKVADILSLLTVEGSKIP